MAVPGFYDGVEPLSDERRREFAELSGTEDSWARRTETRTTTGERGYTALERLWARPSLEVLSLAAGDTGSVTRSVIPAVATASISIRTVPQQDMHAVAVRLRRFVAEHMPPTVEYELTVDEPTEPRVTEAAGGSTVEAAWMRLSEVDRQTLTDLAAAVL